jgi:hypothetical protein
MPLKSALSPSKTITFTFGSTAAIKYTVPVGRKLTGYIQSSSGAAINQYISLYDGDGGNTTVYSVANIASQAGDSHTQVIPILMGAGGWLYSNGTPSQYTRFWGIEEDE